MQAVCKACTIPVYVCCYIRKPYYYFYKIIQCKKTRKPFEENKNQLKKYTITSEVWFIFCLRTQIKGFVIIYFFKKNRFEWKLQNDGSEFSTLNPILPPYNPNFNHIYCVLSTYFSRGSDEAFCPACDHEN